jgi:hypothetical protein
VLSGDHYGRDGRSHFQQEMSDLSRQRDAAAQRVAGVEPAKRLTTMPASAQRCAKAVDAGTAPKCSNAAVAQR